MEDKRFEEFEKIYHLGIDWIARLETTIAYQDETIKKLTQENENYRNIQEQMKELLK